MLLLKYTLSLKNKWRLRMVCSIIWPHLRLHATLAIAVVPYYNNCGIYIILCNYDVKWQTHFYISPFSVHCRKRKTDYAGRLKSPSTSANTYWQIEKESDPLNGEPLSWDERCRIRHMPTRLYLAVESSSCEVNSCSYRVSMLFTDTTSRTTL